MTGRVKTDPGTFGDGICHRVFANRDSLGTGLRIFGDRDVAGDGCGVGGESSCASERDGVDGVIEGSGSVAVGELVTCRGDTRTGEDFG